MSARCDFCNEPHPEWYYPASKVVMTELGWGSTGGWAVCETCSQLIEGGDEHKLMRRALENSPELAAVNHMLNGLTKQEQRYLEDEVVQMHRKFRRARSGPRRAFA